MVYLIEPLIPTGSASNCRIPAGVRALAAPVCGRWYAGVDANGETGAVVTFNGAFFVNSDYPDEPGYAMEKYAFLREL